MLGGYPKTSPAQFGDLPNDLATDQVFTAIFGKDYDKNTFSNACATRVSLGLLNGGVKLSRVAYNITNPTHRFINKGIETSAKNLKDTLSKNTHWGETDVIICKPTSLQEVANIIGKRNGVYFIIGGFGGSVSGHTTLWIEKFGNVIGGHHYISSGGSIYFWELGE